MRCISASIAVAQGLLLLPVAWSAPSHRTDWFQEAGVGIFTHYLWSLQNNRDEPNSQGKQTPHWDEVLADFNVTNYAEAAARVHARYAVITMMQGTQYMIAPNSVYDSYTGYAPGEACSHRDLVLDLHAALSEKGIKLMLYWTGDGPHLDPKAAKGLGWTGEANAMFSKRWGEVAAEYANRYGEKVSGWWVDGCYASSYNYNDTYIAPYAAAFRGGNPNVITAFNNGVAHPIVDYSSFDDYTCGESDTFVEVPVGRWVSRGNNTAQWHELGFMGKHWAAPGVRYNATYMKNYVSRVRVNQGVLTVDACLYRDGTINSDQLDVIAAAFGDGSAGL